MEAVMEQVDAVVVGAGVVGLAVARRLAQAGREVLILEAEDRFGTGISSRNSEVVHAGIYYTPGSLKARLCVEGNRMVRAYAAAKDIPFQACGKLVVATTEDQIEILKGIQARAAACGVDLPWLTGAEARALEPELHAVAALHSPTTAILDSHSLMRALLTDAEEAGATLVCRSPVVGTGFTNRGTVLEIGGPEPMTLEAACVVNAAGLGAPALARSLHAEGVPADYLAKGSYFQLSSPSPFRRLIYPVPQAAGLGVHLTLDLGGLARFGPDVDWIDAIDFDVDPAKAPAFEREIRQYWPGLPEGSLQPAYAGIRPKLQAPGGAAVDFLIQGPDTHGKPGLVHLLGIESPGLTACMAIAEEVATKLGA